METGNEASFVLVIDGLKVERKLSHALTKYPKNGIVLNEILTSQSVNFAIELPSKKHIYRFHIQRLPSSINPEKSKIKVFINNNIKNK